MLGVVVQDGEMTVTDELEVRRPEPHEVSVRVQASGVCRSDLAYLDKPDPRPVVIGHEAAGIVDKVGSAVIGVEPGQLVAVTCQRPCQRCKVCARGLFSACPESFGVTNTPFSWRGRAVRSMGRVSSMASRTVVDAMQVHPVRNLEAGAAALIGCAVSTGYGTVRNVAGLKVGESILVFGVGGIGINSIQTARLLGASRIIAADVNPAKADVATAFGADQFVCVTPGDTAARMAEQISAEIGGSVDVVVDATGNRTVLVAALELLSAGGRLALVGQPPAGAAAEFDMNRVMFRHLTISGALNGACDPFVDIPAIIEHAEQSRLNLADQVSHRWPLTEAAEAFQALRDGNVRRVVLDFP